MKQFFAVIVLLMAGSALTFTAQAAPPTNKGHGYERHAVPPGQSGKHGHARGSSNQDRVSYTHRSLLEAGLTTALAREYAHRYGSFSQQSQLPPGIRKNLKRGKPMPPGIARKLHSEDFRNRLPRYSGYEWQAAGTDLILVSLASGVIADILYDVFD